MYICWGWVGGGEGGGGGSNNISGDSCGTPEKLELQYSVINFSTWYYDALRRPGILVPGTKMPKKIR